MSSCVSNVTKYNFVCGERESQKFTVTTRQIQPSIAWKFSRKLCPITLLNGSIIKSSLYYSINIMPYKVFLKSYHRVSNEFKNWNTKQNYPMTAIHIVWEKRTRCVKQNQIRKVWLKIKIKKKNTRRNTPPSNKQNKIKIQQFNF